MHLYVLSLRTLLLEASELQRASLSQKEYGESVSISTERKIQEREIHPCLVTVRQHALFLLYSFSAGERQYEGRASVSERAYTLLLHTLKARGAERRAHRPVLEEAVVNSLIARKRHLSCHSNTERAREEKSFILPLGRDKRFPRRGLHFRRASGASAQRLPPDDRKDPGGPDSERELPRHTLLQRLCIAM